MFIKGSLGVINWLRGEENHRFFLRSRHNETLSLSLSLLCALGGKVFFG